MLLVATLSALVALFATAHPAAADTTANPLHCKVGFYVTSLHDSSLVTNSFQADIWA